MASVKLQPILSALIGLSLQAREAHRAIHGRGFLATHAFLGDFYAAVDGFTDEVAERMAALGARPKAVAGDFDSPGGGDIEVALVVVQTGARLLRTAVTRATAAAIRADDNGTADLLIRLGAALDTRLWFIAAELGESAP